MNCHLKPNPALQDVANHLTIDQAIEILSQFEPHRTFVPSSCDECIFAQVLSSIMGEEVLIDAWGEASTTDTHLFADLPSWQIAAVNDFDAHYEATDFVDRDEAIRFVQELRHLVHASQ